MPSKIPSVNRQLAIGKQGEEILDRLFEERYLIFPATKQQENELGIDRIFVNKLTGKRSKIEYKFDRQAPRTRNAFVEVMGNVEESRIGWANKSQADWIAYLIGSESAYLFQPQDLRIHLDLWVEPYNLRSIEKRCSGNFWHTKGVLVPLKLLATISYVIPIPVETSVA